MQQGRQHSTVLSMKRKANWHKSSTENDWPFTNLWITTMAVRTTAFVGYLLCSNPYMQPVRWPPSGMAQQVHFYLLPNRVSLFWEAANENISKF
jgi:hypothetical protein